MVVGRITHQIESPLEARRLWNAFVKDGHNLLPSQVPELFSSITFLQGEGGVGTIRLINFTPGNKDFRYVKERVEEVEEEKFEYRYSHVEGGLLGKRLASNSYEFKYIPKQGGGCVCSYVIHFDTLPGVAPDERKEKEIIETSTALFRRIEAYLMAHPNLYC